MADIAWKLDIDGLLYGWDGIIYTRRHDADRAAQEYRESGWQVRLRFFGDRFLLYLRPEMAFRVYDRPG